MSIKYIAAATIAALTLLTGCASGPPDAATLISDATAALGSADLNTIVFSGEGFDGCVGQSFSPNSTDWRKFANRDYSKQLDLNAMAWRMQRVRGEGETPPRGGCAAGPVADQVQNQVTTVNADNFNQVMEFLWTPQGFLKYAAGQTGTVTQEADGTNVLSFPGPNGADIKGYFDGNNLLTRVETMTSENFLGTIPYTIQFMDYADHDGVMFPGHIRVEQGGRGFFDLNVSSVEPGGAVDVDVQAKGKGKGKGGGKGKGKGKGPAPDIAEQLGDGVYLITGGYASIIIDMGDHVMIAEGAQNDARTEQVLAEAERLFPGKEVRYVINTHHHHDHAGGLRAYAARGITILTHEVNADYLREALSNENTLEPGLLEAAGMPAPKIETFGDMAEWTDGTHTIQVHRVANSTHAEGMVIVWLPNEGVMLEADEFNIFGEPGDTVNPYHTNLVDNIERLGLNVRRIIPVHLPGDGHIVTMAELRRWAQR